jgi:protein-disulfide isomerase
MHHYLKLVFNIFLVNFISLGIIHAKDSQNPTRNQMTNFEVVKEIPDIELGSPTATVKVIEYSSLNCTHCARFHNTFFHRLKAKYISTGQVRFVYRYFPIDLTSVHLMAVITTLPQDKWFDAITKAYAQQKEWIGKEYTYMAKICGVSDEACKQSIQDENVLNAIIAKRYNAEQRHAEQPIDATPTFHLISASGDIFINTPISDAELEKKIAFLLTQDSKKRLLP